jgi:YidC/Oxa1 family membrane protein insertase
MEKRLILAIALSLLVLLTWSALAPKPQVVGSKGVIAQQSQPPLLPASQTPVVAPAAMPPVAVIPTETLKFTQDNREIVFNPAAASIVEVIFKDGIEHRLPLIHGLFTENNIVFKQFAKSQDSISFIGEDKNKRITKKFIIPKNSNIIELQTQTLNLSSSPLTLNPQLILGRLDLSAKNHQARYQDVFLGAKDKPMHLSAGKDFISAEVKFIGLRDQYFCAIVEPADLAQNAYIKKITPQESEVGLLLKPVVVNPGAQIGHSYRIYLGPQDLKILSNANLEWSGIIHFGTFDFIAQLMLQLLGFFYSVVHNWGLAIIILSVAVYLLLFPLSMKQMRSMKEMQLLQPKIEALRKELKDNPQKLNKEIMELYKEHKVNPLSGCLPLLLQMPIFFALYQALIRSVALRGAHFLWIKDLSSPDNAFTLKNSIPFLGNQVNILPILMAIGMFVQQKISMSTASGEAQQQQKMMLVIMPIMFGVIFYQMPSGLVLYWFVNSLLMLAYQLKINRQK